MACPSPKYPTKFHVRSVSLPTKLHPTNARIEDELNKFESWSSTCTSSSSSALEGLSRVEELYARLEEILHLKSTVQVLSRNQHEKSIEGLLEGSVKILDVCAVSRELVGQIKEHVRDLQSMNRRRKVGSSLEAGIARFAQLRKKVKKHGKKLIASLKQMSNDIISSSTTTLDHDDDHLTEIVRVLREVQLSSIPVFELLLSFLTEMRPTTRWSVISRMTNRQEADGNNDLDSLDASMRGLCKPGKGDDVEQLHQSVQKQLGGFELTIGRFEDRLENIFRGLIKTRASLLNIISH